MISERGASERDVIKITFNPDEITPNDECWPAFKAGGMTLKFWALYKRSHITGQYFKTFIENLAEYYEDAYDEEKVDVTPYTNIDEFINVLQSCGLSLYRYKRGWFIKNWDYFNLNVQRAVFLEYEVKEVVTTHNSNT